MQKIKIIKTLPHLAELFLHYFPNIAYATNISSDILEFLEDLHVRNIKEIHFEDIIEYISITNAKTKKKFKDKYGEFYNSDKFDLKKNVSQYTKVETVDSVLQFSVKGDTIIIWPVGYTYPIKISFFGSDVENIFLIDPVTGQKFMELKQILLSTSIPISSLDNSYINFKLEDKFIDFHKIIFTNKKIDQRLIDNSKSLEFIDTDLSFPNLFFGNTKLLESECNRFQKLGYDVYINSTDDSMKDMSEKFRSKLTNIVSKFDNFMSLQSLTATNTSNLTNFFENLTTGFISKELEIAFFCDKDIFGRIVKKDSATNVDPQNSQANSKIANLSIRSILKKFEGEINVGDAVVHEDYGICLYRGLELQDVEGRQMEYIKLEFARSDFVYLPYHQFEKVSKYIGNEGSTPELTSLSRGTWQKTKQKIIASIKLTAQELVKTFAKRTVSSIKPIDISDSKDYIEFCDKFGYKLTEDQDRSLREILSDLTKEKPASRLLVGDVGFGKTEVMIRTCFKLVEQGFQVAVLAPTTVLVAQHLKVFRERFANTNYKIDAVYRFNTPSQNSKIVEMANLGKVDILIGTHRLLSSDVKFKNLKMLMVDEEQRFGVLQKEKIKKLNTDIHVLHVSATPIPRSLSMALSSIQDMSIIAQPPFGRKSVYTEIIFNNWEKAALSIRNEISRGGQVYFIHNRISTIETVYQKLKSLIPDLRAEFAHGKMTPKKLDDVITNFYLGKFDVLVCTSIVENGLDLPNVNTIIMHDAHKFGLSQLYQLRGRVGRSDVKAYCYLMAPRPSVFLDRIDGIDDDSTRFALVDDSDIDNQNNLDVKEDAEIAISEGELVEKLDSVKKSLGEDRLYMSRLNALVENQDLGAAFKIASKDLEIRGAGNILGEKQHGHIVEVGYSLYVQMLAQEVERLNRVGAVNNNEFSSF